MVKILVNTIQYELDSIGLLLRGTVKDSFKFIVRESMAHMEKSSRHEIKHQANNENYNIFVQISDDTNIGAYLFCDQEYPRRQEYQNTLIDIDRVAFRFLQESINAFEGEIKRNWELQDSKDKDYKVPQIGISMRQFQDPLNVDQLMKAQKTIDEAKINMHETIQKLLERGQSLDQMVEKSKDLSTSAKTFHKTSKKMNSGCCTIY